MHFLNFMKQHFYFAKFIFCIGFFLFSFCTLFIYIFLHLI